MKKYKCTFLILAFVYLHFNLFADIRPVPIQAKSINAGGKTSVRMGSEKVIVDLYNDSSVVKCEFRMKNLGDSEKLQIAFPEMNFYHLRLIRESEKLDRFKVKENGKEVRFYLADSLKNNEEFRKKFDSYQVIEDWYLWDGEFQKGESKTIEVQYSLPFGARYKSNKRFFTYLLSTGADWNGSIGYAEIVVNLKDIAIDSIVSQKPSGCVVSDNQLVWTFTDFEPTAENDVIVNYNSNKNLYKGKVSAPPLIMINGEIKEDFELDDLPPTAIASFEFDKNSVSKESENGVFKIYTKNYLVAQLDRIIKSKSKEKIGSPGYDELKENYCLFVNDKEVDFSKIVGIDEKNISKVHFKNSSGKKSQILIEMK
ncbi:MAG TPA: hypothetical protein DER09_10265 [Prolixibacteraceae bacterium]|nr:hypothetical protein [Prolixibacteraceae bacterium]